LTTIVGELDPALLDEIESVALSVFGKDQLTGLVSLKTHPLANGSLLGLSELGKEGCVLDELFLHDVWYLPRKISNLANLQICKSANLKIGKHLHFAQAQVSANQQICKHPLVTRCADPFIY
jgi:hypothetical protein